MTGSGIHTGLDAQLATLGDRIDAARRRAEQKIGFDRLQASSEIPELERRLRRLEAKAALLARAAPGIGRSLAAEIQFLLNDLQGNIEDFVRAVDTHSRARRHSASEP